MAIAIDPVCGMEVDTATSRAVLRARGHDVLVLRSRAACSSSRTTRETYLDAGPPARRCEAARAISRS